MPSYSYKCQSCGHIFENFFSMSAYQKELDCPICNSSAQLVISGGSGLIFKGSGFYITDYKNKGTSKNKKEHDLVNK